MTRRTQSEVDELVDDVFCGPAARYGPYRRDGPAQQRHGGLLHIYPLVDAHETTKVALQVYTDTGDIGGVLWERQVRALLKVGTRQHPALPRIIGGDQVEDHKLAFVLTDAADHTLAEPNALPWLQQRPIECIRQLRLLSQALVVLHGERLMHRNVWPGTVEAVRDSTDPDRIHLRLAQFELSALVSNLMWTRPDDGYDRAYRHELLAAGPRHRAFIPPERMAAIFGGRMQQPESDRGDVFSLGVMAWEWFLGPIPAELLATVSGEGPEVPQRLADLRAELVRRLTRAEFGLDATDGAAGQRKLPTKLLDLLDGMLRPDRTRLTAYQVHDQISRDYEALVGVWSPDDGSNRPRLVAFMTEQARPTVYNWNWISHDPTTVEGRRQLQHLIQEDLRGGKLVHSERGADGYVSGENIAAKREAKHVLMGKRAAWFCSRYRPRSPFGELGEPYDDVLLIRFVADLTVGKQAHGLRELARAPGYGERVISAVDAVPWDIGDARLDALRAGRPDWTGLITASMERDERPEWMETFERSLDFLTQYQQVELEAREYAFTRVSERGDSEIVRVEFDAPRDRHRVGRYQLMGLYNTAIRRPGFAEFFTGLESEDSESDMPGAAATLGYPELEYREDDRGHPKRGSGGRARVADLRALDDNMIEIRRRAGAPPVPERGWLRPAHDRFDHQALVRERRASTDLVAARTLLHFLHEPLVIREPDRRWRHAGKGLHGGADERVRNMLSSRPFYALQGPPGTGKTTAVAHAVEALLQQEPSSRLLVAAQSNAAVDNLALTILQRLEKAGIDLDVALVPLRVATGADWTQRIDKRVQPYVLDRLTERRIPQMIATVETQIERVEDEGLRKVLGAWRGAIEASTLELQGRFERGASLVFATCAGSTQASPDLYRSVTFDWVIVEEAAKAWPGELAIPLVQGVRWTMVGDHRQLPAHRLQDVERFLDRCALDDAPEIEAHGRDKGSYMQTFRLFGQLFEKEAPPGFDSATEMLATQFRMRRPMAEVVSKAFYGGDLRTWPTTEVPSGLVAPPLLADRALVWLDTEGVAGCADDPYWANPGEAALVAELLRQLRPEPRPRQHGFGPNPLAVLTPYRQQTVSIRQSGVPRQLIHTVHSFQGREADIVVLSLVRDQARVPRNESRQVYGNLGHLAQPEVANVALSRAKRLLVVVGRYRHFAESNVAHWERVCETVAAEGIVVGPERLLGLGGVR